MSVWSLARAAKTFLVEPETVARWMRRIAWRIGPPEIRGRIGKYTSALLAEALRDPASVIEEVFERIVLHLWRNGVVGVQDLEGQVLVRRDDIDAVRLDLGAVLDLRDFHMILSSF